MQRGRGAGFRAALASPEDAAHDLLSCVQKDPRWDRQVESRDAYYASLLFALGSDLAPLGEWLAQSPVPFDAWLALYVLANLARRGSPQAARLLGEQARGDRLWKESIEALCFTGGEPLLAEVFSLGHLSRLCQEVEPQELVASALDSLAPWPRLAAQLPALRPLVLKRENREETTRVLPALPASASTEELLRRATEPGLRHRAEEMLALRRDPASLRALFLAARADDERSPVALRILGVQGRGELLPDAEAHLRREINARELAPLAAPEARTLRLRRGFLRYLAALPGALTLEWARKHFSSPWPLSLAAEQILARHATRDDAAVLLSAGEKALAEREMYRLGNVLDALYTLRAAETLPKDALPFLGRVCEEGPYSYVRSRALHGLAQNPSHPEAQRFLVEALWDCESAVRVLACEHADPSPEVETRLRELSKDRGEDDEVRDAAADRLDEL